MPVFSHLHCHTQYSLLDGQASISALMKKAQKDGMPAVALTDHGNMFGAFNFVAEANKYNVKPIVGCEFYLVEDRHKKAFSREKGRERQAPPPAAAGQGPGRLPQPEQALLA